MIHLKYLNTPVGHWNSFKKLLKFICFIDSKVVLIENK